MSPTASKYACTRSARGPLTPSTFIRSSTLARATPRADPNACSNARFRPGPRTYIGTGAAPDADAGSVAAADEVLRAARQGPPQAERVLAQARSAVEAGEREAARREATVVAVGVLPATDGDPLDGAPNLCQGQAKSDPYSRTLNYYTSMTVRQPVRANQARVPSLTLFSSTLSEYKAFLRRTPIGGALSVTDPFPITGLPSTLSYQVELGRTEAEPAFFCAVFNASGQPAASLPLGQSSTGLPIGIHLAAPFGMDETLIALCAELERAAPWAARRAAMAA